ncbi:MAG: hypothetical protein AB1757_20915 [Acidobacteriota bacterium]
MPAKGLEPPTPVYESEKPMVTTYQSVIFHYKIYRLPPLRPHLNLQALPSSIKAYHRFT